MIIHAASMLPEFNNNPEVNSILCEVLRLREDEELSELEKSKSEKMRGNEVLKLMNLLFKNA